MASGSMGGYGSGQADSQWRSPATASSAATAQGPAKRSWSGQVRVWCVNEQLPQCWIKVVVI